MSQTYCKLDWVLWACINLQKTLVFIRMQKFNITNDFFLEILARQCICNIDCFRHALQHPKTWKQQLLENFDVYLHKNQLHPHFFLEIMQKFCKCILGTLGITWHAKPNATSAKVWNLYACKKSTPSLHSFLRYFKDIAKLFFWEFRSYIC